MRQNCVAWQMRKRQKGDELSKSRLKITKLPKSRIRVKCEWSLPGRWSMLVEGCFGGLCFRCEKSLPQVPMNKKKTRRFGSCRRQKRMGEVLLWDRIKKSGATMKAEWCFIANFAIAIHAESMVSPRCNVGVGLKRESGWAWTVSAAVCPFLLTTE